MENIQTAYDLQQAVAELVEAFIQDHTKEVKAKDLGLDDRCYGLRITTTLDNIVCNLRSDRALQYYGGFEYVLEGTRSVVGEWVFYSAECDRIADHIDCCVGSQANEPFGV